MISALYIENDVANHPRVQALKQRYANVPHIYCERYGEVFNPKSQNFRLQKKAPALIVARKHSGHVLAAPDGYGAGEGRAFYFSHMLNCLYDCRYCFLQGMYSSAHYVLFVNFEEFGEAIDRVLAENTSQEKTWFNSGYDGDSLALEPLSKFVEHFVPFFRDRPRAILELRTKSTQIRCLTALEPIDNVVCAFSFTPASIAQSLEHKVPDMERRIAAMVELQNKGWRVGVRFEPLIWCEEFKTRYRDMFSQVLEPLNMDRVDSVSIGSFRMPDGFFKKSRELYPNEPLFAGPLDSSSGVVGYTDELDNEMTQFCTDEILTRIDSDKFYHCKEAAA